MTEESYKKLNVDEVLEAIQKGEISAEQALDYELVGKKRKTLLDALKEMIEPSADDTPELETRSHEVTFNQNIKFGKNRFKRGEETKVSAEEYSDLLKAGVIQVGE